MKSVFRLLLLICLLTACTSEKKKKDLYSYIPEEASIVIKSNGLQSLVSNIENNHFLQQLNKTPLFNELANKTSLLNHLNNQGETIISFLKDNNNTLQYAVLTRFNDSIFKLDSIPNHSLETITTQNQTFKKATVNKQVLYTTIKDSIFIGATSQELLLSSIKGQPNSNKTLLKTASNNSQLSVYIDEKKTKMFSDFFVEDTLRNSKLTEFSLIDINLEQDELLFNGITKATDSTKSLIHVFNGTTPQKNDIQRVTPSNSDGFLSLTFNNFNTFHENLKRYQKPDTLNLDKTLFGSITEVGVIFQGNKQAIVLNSLDETTTSQAISLNKQHIETYRSIDIFSFNQPTLFKNTFYPFINDTKANKYIVLDNFFVFSNNTEVLQNIIANYQNNTTLSDKSYFKNITEKLSDESSLLISANTTHLNDVLKRSISEKAIIKNDNYKWATIQFINDNNFAHIHGIIKKNKAKAAEASVIEEFNIKLNERLLNTPQFVKNHVTKEKEIVVQDIKNNLYLISNKGKVLWKKQLPGAILGKINQIDMYKNGRLQLAFATSNRVHVIDRNGNDVKPFPIKFNDQITQPLSVFDYDNNKKYRLLITQGKDIFMIDAKGKTVKGFTFKSANSAIIHQPQHIRIGRKDYIILKTNDKLYILDRTGKTRITPKKQYNYSNQAVYEYQNNFATTTKNGILVTIDQKGNTASRDLNLTDRHYLTTTIKTLVAQSENRLTIKNKTLEMDYGNYTAPEIFYLYDKIYVAITDLQTNKIHLFDSSAKYIDNFPVYGASKIELDNIDKDRNLEFVTKGSDNSILIYQIN
ncbi:ribonuclease HII [Mangrovimonas spongiae]|uniref:Ribonuclease HII n=1 Tax=Mangrovimonas spongiae TaxID=2494697 RepID=A0A3R9P1A7_9FLAO|nr:ribonuclease HII [Mangrovimonas spongiae]RSK42124.1 ribonuclease HII [Mangrovimonas spongiae]